MDAAVPDFTGLSEGDLEALRLGAQVMSHKAGLEHRSRVADYFAHLEDALKAEMAFRSGAARRSAIPRSGLPGTADAEDRRLVAEYLGLLVANERLSPALRSVCRMLRARDSR
ncbi:MAG TPA: hypothetical protein VK992_05595 [Candidatus Caenarcaniphilales bacterium]|nr:hypothetical protein [Candidatus Caenarcaniphilales bacterium]